MPCRNVSRIASSRAVIRENARRYSGAPVRGYARTSDNKWRHAALHALAGVRAWALVIIAPAFPACRATLAATPVLTTAAKTTPPAAALPHSPRSSSTARPSIRRRNCSPRTATSSAARFARDGARHRGRARGHVCARRLREARVHARRRADRARRAAIAGVRSAGHHVIYEGDGGKFDDALDDIGTRLENARPLRKDDVQQALRAMRQIAGPRGHGDHATRPGHSQCVRARGAGGLFAGRWRGAHEQSRHGPGRPGIHAGPVVCQRPVRASGKDRTHLRGRHRS